MLPALANAGTCGSGYSFYRTVTIDHTKVQTADQSNFPVLFSGTYSYLATVAHSGNVQSSSGYDIIFCDASSAGNQLSHEVESWTDTSGAIQMWLKVTTVSHTSDTVLYLFYGNSSASNTSNVTDVWSNGYQEVYHLLGITGTGLNDSTSTANNGTNHSTTAVAGQIDGAIALASASSQYVSAGTDSTASAITVSAWVNITTNATFKMIASTLDPTTNNFKGWELRIGATSGDGRIQWIWAGGGTGNHDCNASPLSPLPSTGAWHYIEASATGTTGVVSLDGAGLTVFGAKNCASLVASSVALNIGARAAAFFFNGDIDEVRVSSVVRDANWVKTEYNNQNSPSTFYAVGTEIPVPSRARIRSQIY